MKARWAKSYRALGSSWTWWFKLSTDTLIGDSMLPHSRGARGAMLTPPRPSAQAQS